MRHHTTDELALHPRHRVLQKIPETDHRNDRLLFAVYVAFVMAILCVEGVVSFHSMNEWKMGDWLINYRAGFVRRGLTGEAALRAGHLLHLSPALVILAIQLACYGIVLVSMYRLAARSSWAYWVKLTILSPATLGFPVLDWAGGFRKEILLFAGLGSLLLMFRRPLGDATLVMYTSLLAVGCVLSHEALLVYLPYLFATLAIGLKSISRASRICILPVALVLVAAFQAFDHRGDEQAARTICASLGYSFSTTLPAPCQGGIAYLGRDPAPVRQEVISYAQQFHHATVYPVVATLAALPILLGFIALSRWKLNRRPLLILATTAFTSIAASSILFFYALDWGRWIYIHVVCISLLLLFIDSLRGTHTNRPIGAVYWQKFALCCGLLLYATCWNLPHVGGYALRFGYVGLLSLLVHAR